MAKKEYAYFLKGNKLAIAERDVNAPFDNDLTSRDYGPDVPYSSWKSPLADVTNGLEIEYAYSPKYFHSGNFVGGDKKVSYHAWIVVDGYLTFVQGFPTSPIAWSSRVSLNDYFLVRGSDRWNGLHKVQSVDAVTNNSGTHWGLKTYTKVSVQRDYKYMTQTPAVQSDGVTIRISSNQFVAGDYIWLAGALAANGGLYRVASVSAFSTVVDNIVLDKRIHRASTDLFTTDEVESAPGLSADGDGTEYYYQAFKEDTSAYIEIGIDILNDENDELPISEYLSKAVVLYVKAKQAEDGGNIDMKEYFMKEFRKMVEKQESANMAGPRIVSSGINAIR